MTDNNAVNETTALILRDFELQTPAAPMSEAELLAYVAEAIGYMIEHKLDFLLSLLYRLDVSEAKINAALSFGTEEPANLALARLVLERQKQRVATKQAYREQNPTTWNWDFE